MAVEQLKDVQMFAEAMEIDTAIVVRGLTLKAFNSLTLKTPVDTGRARANWQIAVGEPALGVVGQPTKGTGENKEKTKPPAAPEANANFPFHLVDGTAPVWITNNLPYIERLENGHSKQAPSGMIALTYAEIQGEIDARIFYELGIDLT